ncbi:autotransporter assembly complex protein TamA [Chitinasiproducens palmae]|uniref:Translocation and assembly module subunit TamA n=2 Tax=Chitinasiproducens palmae TaxID=1770053 RepID=A0A1H2PP04_9BURK|nr:autotransporter assembly complex family protein [Chitinasiproducens palmae]SDV47997.1 autotransporter secretion outer membrane protein TamA [Chitinasiproducens palmae]
MLLGTLAVLGVGHAAPALADYRVDIESPRSLRKLLKDNLDLVRFAKRKDLSEEQFDFLLTAAPQQVKELVQTQGYFSPAVSTDVSREGDERTVTITVEPGPRTAIHSLNVAVTGPVQTEAPARVDASRNAFSLQPGAPFTQSDWTDAKSASLDALQAQRYLGARLTHSEARIDARTQQADLTVAYDSGPTFTLGPLSVSGVKRYPAWIVDHVNPLHVGEVYSRERIQELQRQIQNTPYYASVAIDVANDPQHPNEAPVSVKVSEFPYHNLRSGIGYSTDTGARVEGTYSYNNMFGRAWVLSTQGRLEQDSRYGSIQLAMPPDEKAYVNSALASYQSTDVEDTNIYSARFGVQRTRTLQFYDYAYSLIYHQDRLEQNVGPGEIAKALVPSFAWTRRDVDDPTFPRKGNLFGVELGFAVRNVLSDATFARVYSHGRQYFPLGKRDLVLLRAELGGVFSDSASRMIPASLRFRGGGAASIRGYGYQSVGNNVSGSVLPTKYLVTGGAEYQHWLNRDWGGAVFYDVGTAADVWRERRFYSGVGFGVRWRSPVGPVNLDLAYGLQNHSIRPYITLGVAF